MLLGHAQGLRSPGVVVVVVVRRSWVRHNKVKKLSQAMAHLPDQMFDTNLIVTPYLDGYGTQVCYDSLY